MPKLLGIDGDGPDTRGVLLEDLDHLLQQPECPLQRVEVGGWGAAKVLRHVAGEHPLHREAGGHPAIGER
jgi:hypothetical protein